MLENLCGCLHAFHDRLADRDSFAVRDEQNIHGDFGTDLCVELLNENFVADRNLILFTTGLNDCVHCFVLPPSSQTRSNTEMPVGILKYRSEAAHRMNIPHGNHFVN